MSHSTDRSMNSCGREAIGLSGSRWLANFRAEMCGSPQNSEVVKALNGAGRVEEVIVLQSDRKGHRGRRRVKDRATPKKIPAQRGIDLFPRSPQRDSGSSFGL